MRPSNSGDAQLLGLVVVDAELPCEQELSCSVKDQIIAEKPNKVYLWFDDATKSLAQTPSHFGFQPSLVPLHFVRGQVPLLLQVCVWITVNSHQSSLFYAFNYSAICLTAISRLETKTQICPCPIGRNSPLDISGRGAQTLHADLFLRDKGMCHFAYKPVPYN